MGREGEIRFGGLLNIAVLCVYFKSINYCTK